MVPARKRDGLELEDPWSVLALLLGDLEQAHHLSGPSTSGGGWSGKPQEGYEGQSCQRLRFSGVPESQKQPHQDA